MQGAVRNSMGFAPFQGKHDLAEERGFKARALWIKSEIKGDDC